jgi:exopolysaccharide production protein ExoQ
MTDPGRAALLGVARDLLSSPRMAWTVSVVSIMVALLTTPISKIIGWPGLVAIVVGLTLLCAGVLLASREFIEWQGLLPISLLAFLGWSLVSVAWSQYTWASIGAVGYQFAFAIIGVTIALTRDTIQIVRAFGDCLRIVLAASLAMEVFSGLIIDTAVPGLGIQGNLAVGGPIQGLVGSRNAMGLVALIAIVTFAVEYRTRSVRRGLAIGSLVAAGFTVLFTQSPVVTVVTVVVVAAMGTIALLRRSTPERRIVIQSVLAVVVVVGTLIAYLARGQVVATLNAASESEYRIDLWRRLGALVQQHLIEGWGWIGAWDTDIVPFSLIRNARGGQHGSALNGFVDVAFQLGIVGLLLFAVLLGLAFVRSWILASRQHSSAVVWCALVLVALVALSLAESATLTDVGWMILVIASVTAARQLSWRGRFASWRAPSPDVPLS